MTSLLSIRLRCFPFPSWRGLLVIWLVALAAGSACAQVRTGPDGRFVRYGNRLLVLVGDSGTQCVLQNPNIDYRAWIDDCARAGLNAVSVWSFMAPRQTRDGRIVERRYGYVYPGITPWARRTGGPAARDGWPQWDLRQFDEGDDPNKHYWPRVRDLCRYAKQKDVLVAITVFFGWPKHQSDWAYHPMNVVNGGHLTDHHPIIEAVQQIATPGTEVFEQPWSDAWSAPKKTQWIWERFAAKLLKETQPFGNVFYIFMDERSYSEGNCGDHFARFFRSRGAFWIDGQLRREHVDAVVDGHGPGRDLYRAARQSLDRQPPRPFFEFELPPYRGSAVRHNLYACLFGLGHYFFHDDQDQETPTTGVMSYDPHVRNSRLDAVRERLRWLGIGCRLMNERVRDKRKLKPDARILREGRGYALASPGSQYVVYVKSGGKAILSLDDPADDYDVTLVNPRTGNLHRAEATKRGNEIRLVLPDDADWIVLAQTR